MQKLLKGELADIKQRKMALDTRTMAGRSLFDRLSAQEEIMLSKYTVEKAELEKAKVELREGKSKVQKSDYESSFDDVSSIGEEISNSATGKVKSDFLNVSSDSDVSGFETMVQKMKALRRKNDIESLEIKKKQLSKSKHITVSLLKDRKTTVDLKRSLKDETRKLNRVLDLALDNIEDDISFEVLGKKNQPSREQTDDISEDIPEVHSSESDIKEDIVADSLEDVASSIIQEEFEFDEPVTSKTKSLNIKDSIAKTLSVQAEFDEFVLDIEKNVAHLSDGSFESIFI